MTSLTTLLALVSLFIFGGEVIRPFALTMIIGVIIGTYSSLFVATAFLGLLKVNYKTLEKNEENMSN